MCTNIIYWIPCTSTEHPHGHLPDVYARSHSLATSWTYMYRHMYNWIGTISSMVVKDIDIHLARVPTLRKADVTGAHD